MTLQFFKLYKIPYTTERICADPHAGDWKYVCQRKRLTQTSMHDFRECCSKEYIRISNGRCHPSK